MKALALLLASVALLAGCSHLSTRKTVELGPFRRIYVERRLTDNHRIDELLVAELRHLGRDASSGPLTMMPENTDAILTYADRWEWDFKDYMIEFTLEFQTAKTRKKLADGRYYQPTIKTKSPAEVVREILAPLFKAS
jgi:hypothetical protein